MREIYLDNSATTRVHESVREEMIAVLNDEYGNPSSLHRKGVQAEEKFRQAARRIADSLKVSEKEIFFTSGGTESNNLAIIGAAMAHKRRGRHLITSCFEHPSVSMAMAYLQKEGFEVTYLPVDERGLISPESVRDAMREDTILVSIMMVNNEIGAAEPIRDIGKAIKAANPDTLFHVDAIQGYGKYEIRPRSACIDLLSASGHKIHGPKGVGFLYVRDKARILPIIHGGEQQKGLRSGTENMPGIVGLGCAAQLVTRNLPGDVEKLYALKERLTQGLLTLDGVTVNGPSLREGAPHIVSASFSGVRSEVLLHALEDKGIYVSAGSACSSHKKGTSPTLAAIGLSPALADCTLRLSLGLYNTDEDIDDTIEALRELLPMLRRFYRR